MITYNLEPQVYFDNVGINVSGLNLLDKSPAHYKASLQATKKSSPALLLGSAVHCAVLEPEEFGKRYALADYDRRTKEGKAKHQEMLDQGIEGLPFDVYTQVIGMQKSVMTHPLAKNMLEGGKTEVSCFQVKDGVHTKARADLVKHNYIVDLKTTQDASPREFMKSIMTFKYYRQAAWYVDLFSKEMDIDTFYFLCVEKEPPYAVAIYELDSDLFFKGEADCLRLFETYKHCLATDEWHGYPEEIKTLGLGDRYDRSI